MDEIYELGDESLYIKAKKVIQSLCIYKPTTKNFFNVFFPFQRDYIEYSPS